MGIMTHPLAQLSLEELRERRSIKWQWFPPDVLPVWVAELDTPLAPPIVEALHAAVRRGDTGYAMAGRLPEAYAGFAERRYGWRPDPTRMRLMPDVMRGVVEALRITTEPGSPVLVNTPVYHPFFFWLEHLGRPVVQSSLRLTESGYQLDLERLERDFAAGVGAYLLCNPHNPTGLVFSRDELLAVSELAEQYDVQIIADEIHAPLTYPGTRFVPFGSLPTAAAERAVTSVSASKAWNLAGLKAALLVPGPRADIDKIPEEYGHAGSIFGVLASEAAFDHGEPWLDTLLTDLDANRALLGSLLAEHLPEVRYFPPRATYLTWLDCRALRLPADPAEIFMEYGKVAVVSGPIFGDGGEGFVRLNIGCSPELLTEAVRRMAAVVAKVG